MKNITERKIKEFTVKQVLAWSDKHRALSDNEGVRVVYIKQLLTEAIAEATKELEGAEKRGRAEVFSGKVTCSRHHAPLRCPECLEELKAPEGI